MKITILDLEINNIRSIQRAVNDVKLPGDDLRIIKSPEAHLIESSLVILPGVGNFNRGTHAIDSLNIRETLIEISKTSTKIVGICLGMQLLFQSSEEAIGKEGLGLIPGRCEKINAKNARTVPHMGWNTVQDNGGTNDFKSLSSGKDFYFVHSYHVIPQEKEDIFATTPLLVGEFVSAVKRNNVIGYQFHPEKSGVVGRELLSETLEWARNEN